MFLKMLLLLVVEELTKSLKDGMFGDDSSMSLSVCIHTFDPFPKGVNLILELLRTCWGALINRVFLQMVISIFLSRFDLRDVLVI